MEDYRVTQTGDEIQEILNQSPIDTADIAELKEAATSLDGRLESVEVKIPAGASEDNPLTDKQYVDDSIASASATFRGTYNEVTDLELTTDATHADIGSALDEVIELADSNDYCFVQIPTDDETPTEIESIERYKFVTGTGWEYEYTLNNSGFTADQWSAINSGITRGLVTKLADLPTNAELETLLNGKANAADVYTKSETYNKTELDSMITTPDVQYVSVTATAQTTSVTDVLPATGEADTIYRVGSWGGTQYDANSYSEYSWNGTAYVLLNVKNTGIATGSDFDNPTAAQRTLLTTVGAVLDGCDAAPTPSSVKPVQSGGVYEAVRSIVDSSPSSMQDSELAISDEGGNIILQLEGGEIKTKNFNSADVQSITNDERAKLAGIEAGADKSNVGNANSMESSSDFRVADENGNVLVDFSDGHIHTKNFNSTEVPKGLDGETSYLDSDFNISDENGNVLVQFSNGGIKTKNFDSENISDVLEYPVFIGKEIDADGVTVIPSTNRLVTPFVKVSKGDIVHINDSGKIDGIYVYEYQTDSPLSAIATSGGFISKDYVVSNANTAFVKIVGKPNNEDPLLIDGVIYGNSAFVGNVCVIHKTPVSYDDSKKIVNSCIPDGWYTSTESEFSTVPSTDPDDPWESAGSKLTLTQIYAKLNELASDYSDYFYLTQLGYDSSNGKEALNSYSEFSNWEDGNGKLHIPVYKFELIPSDVTVAGGKSAGVRNADIPTVYIESGIHPGEPPCTRALMNFLVHICRDWRDDEFLTWLRWNCKIVGIPVVVPYSYVDLNSSPTVNGRCNYNGVNINRNFYGNGLWNTVSPSSGGNNKGESYLSEIETKYVMRSILENADMIAGFDLHTHGIFTSWDNITVFDINPNNSLGKNILMSVCNDVIRGGTVSGWKNHKVPYPLSDGSKYIGQVHRDVIPSASSIFSDIVSPVGTLELLYRYYNGESGSIYNIYTDCLNEEILVNSVLCSIRNYSTID